MTKKRILILGSGVSGLAAAWEIAKKKKDAECTILEKENVLGGWMGSETLDGFLIEKGPRVFKTSRNRELLAIAEEIGFTSRLIPSPKKANVRYLWLKGKLQKMPTSLFSFLFSSLTRPVLLSLFKEIKAPVNLEDETISEFISRRFGKKVAETFFDPLVLGIYAGDMKKLSIEACFPLLKNWEREHGSILKGVFAHVRKKKEKKPLPLASSLFSFEGGTSAFLEKWVSQIPFPIHFGQEITSLIKTEKGWKAQTLTSEWEADQVILALPSHVSSKLLSSFAPNSASLLDSISYEDITSISIGWNTEVLPVQSFGYLVPTIEKEPLLGVLFDSCISNQTGKTLITIMVRGISHTEEVLNQIGERAIQEHLGIFQRPDHFSYKKMAHSIPQYSVNHLSLIEKALNSLKEEAPQLFLTGNYLKGVSINDSINKSKELIISCVDKKKLKFVN